VKRLIVFALIFLFVACAQRMSPMPRSYVVPIDAAENALKEWGQSDVKACFGEPKEEDMVGGWPREYYARSACKLYFMFRDGRVHSVEGYGNVQECWWLMDAYERNLEYRTAPTEQWLSWTPDEIVKCFGEPTKDIVESGYHQMRVDRGGCQISLDLEDLGRIFMRDWIETDTGACKRLLRSC